MSSMHCDNCESPLTAKQSRCTQCGHISANFVYKSRVATATLALLGGALGLHRFYLGQWRALVYLLFCWTPIPWFIALVECVVFMSTDQTRWNQKYYDGIGHGRESAKVLAAFIIIVFLMVGTALVASLYIPFQAMSGLAEQQNDIQAAQTLSSSAQRYIKRTGRRPQGLNDLSLSQTFVEKYGERIQITNGRIIMQYSGGMPGYGMMGAGELIMEPVIVQQETFWDCSESTIPATLYPGACR